MDYVDANILIYAFDDDGKKGKASKELLSDPLTRFATSMLTLDEVAYKFFKLSKRSANDASRVVSALSELPNLEFVPFLEEDISRFRQLLSAGFPPRDAIHLLCAEKTGCKALYSEDRDFDRQKAIPRRVPWKK
jgi:predicted nucleic acid-binding protein